MNQCFKILGLEETATKAQVQEAYKQKIEEYCGDAYIEEPKYAKKKLDELQAAYEDAFQLAGVGETPEELQENLDQYMQELYHKHLTNRVNRLAGVHHVKRSKKQKEMDDAYKKDVVLFWVGVLTIMIVVGLIL